MSLAKVCQKVLFEHEMLGRLKDKWRVKVLAAYVSIDTWKYTYSTSFRTLESEPDFGDNIITTMNRGRTPNSLLQNEQSAL